MNPALSEIVTVLLGGAAGAAAGAISARRCITRPEPELQPEPVLFDDFPETQARQVARQWREANHRPPEAEGILYKKLRLGWDLSKDRRHRRGGFR